MDNKAGPLKTTLAILRTTAKRLRKRVKKVANPQAAILPMIHNGHLKPARKAVKCPGEDLRINKLGKAAAVSFRKMILSVPAVPPNGVAKEDIQLALNLTRRRAWGKRRKLFRTKTAE